MMIRERLEGLVEQAVFDAIKTGDLELDEVPPVECERPRDLSHGDWASAVALRSAKLAHANPREIAKAVVDHLPENEIVKSVEIAGPGFINFRLADAVLQGVVAAVRQERENYGKGQITDGSRKVNLEYISANPTGPLHVGHGRWAALGDSMARVMRHAGYEVAEEFYINDHGVQMDVFGNSIAVRYMQLLGNDVEMPEDCYGGSYIADIARGIIDREGRKYEDMPASERATAFREIGYREMLDNQQRLLEKFGTTFDTWFSERTLYESLEGGGSLVDQALDTMRGRGHLYEKDGATWFATSKFGDDKDRVLIKADGAYTYFMSDVAYHYNKMQRGFTHLIDLWGADHHGYIKRCEAMMEAWGYPGRLEVVLGQLVNLLRDGVPVRMSKRTGEMVTFEELIDEVGVDATRFLMLSCSSDQPVDFDISLAKKQDSSNPVYYVQYAHARICSILRKAAEEPDASVEELSNRLIPAQVDLSVLTHESELALMRKMADFEEVVSLAARDRAPYRLTHYVQEVAGLFHQFYTNCRIIGEDYRIRCARLALADATRTLLALSLGLIGVSAPERMQAIALC